MDASYAETSITSLKIKGPRHHGATTGSGPHSGNAEIPSCSIFALAHLYYIYNVTCYAFQGGTVGTGNFAWEPIYSTSLQEPNCGDEGNQVIAWSYAVSAPGYAIASGQVGM
jgi:hypothetical protein